jgi:predicted RNA-binding protein YlxR (DUF448 family)
MCLACRQRAPKAELTRLVARDGRYEVDPTGRAQTRGAYSHPGCLEKSLCRPVRRRGPASPTV